MQDAPSTSGSRYSKRPTKKVEKKPAWHVSRVGAKPSKEPQPPTPGNGPFSWRDGIVEECESDLWSEDGAPVLAYLQSRGFLEETLRHWRFGAHLIRNSSGKVVDQYVALPVPRSDGVIINMRFRSVPGQCLKCDGVGCRSCKSGQVQKVYLRCTGADSTLFGVHNLDGDDNSSVIITEGELDVVAMWQYGFKSNVVSGTAGAGTWADEWLDLLEPYRHFTILYDDDDKGHDGAKKVAKSLGLTRCSRAVLPFADAAECMKKAVPSNLVSSAIDNAKPLLDVSLVTVDRYTDEIERLISNPDELKGLPTGSSRLDDGIGGWAPGLVIVTGDTAAGKTSFTTWCGHEQSLRGIPVMLTSFEQRPIGTVQKLLRAYMGGDFTFYTQEQRRSCMEALGKLPLYMLDHYGELDSDDCLKALDYANRRLGVRFAVVDHLGFLVRGAEDERRAIEDAVRSYALFAVQRGMTIALIAHPNNLSVVQQRRVRLGDLKGASAIRQDAHVGLVVERMLPGKAIKHPAAAVHVDKCRSEFGLQGSRLVLYYDPEACVYADSWEATPMGIKGKSGGFPMPGSQ